MDTEVMITVGHTDSIGTDEYNQNLSIRGAEAVRAYLVSKNIEGNRVYAEGNGEKEPVADNKTAAGRAQNCSVTVEVVGTHSVKNQFCGSGVVRSWLISERSGQRAFHFDHLNNCKAITK